MTIAIGSLVYRRNDFRWFSFLPRSTKKVLLWGLAGGVIHIVLVELLQLVFPSARSDVYKELTNLGFGTEYTKPLVMIVTMTILAPVFEEMFYRGIMFRALRDGLAKLGIGKKIVGNQTWAKAALLLAVIVSTAAFMSAHSEEGMASSLYLLYALMPLTTIFVYLKTGSLTASIITHAFNNCWVLTSALLQFPTRLPQEFVFLSIAGPFMAYGFALLLGKLFTEKSIDT
ncbi:MAG: protease family protein [Patescibacteria group bacterium]|nr:CPBP family intramembrane metalloprotease [Candidatus Saccharibacteria bacterium]MDQ5963118.1 protease family protein [Patescibacteria group bacterium]